MGADEKARMAVAARLRMAREMAGLSQAQVAKKLGLHRPSVTEMEAGRRSVTAEEIVVLADLYAVSIDWLTRGSDEKMDLAQQRFELAARELGKLKPKDVDRLLQVLTALREKERPR